MEEIINRNMAIPEYLPHEPHNKPVGALAYLIRFVLRLVFLIILAVATSLLWPIYWLASFIWGWPPNVVRMRQVIRYLRLTWTVSPPAPGLRWRVRPWLTLMIIQKVLLSPVNGLAWLLDEVLYGATLDATPLTAPLMEISAGRSGSTQIARYLEEDPDLAAPSLLQSFFPYLWLWRLAPRTIGRFITPEIVRQKLQSMMPPELLERHEADPFKTDTFDGVLYSSHLNALSFSLGPEVAIDEFGFGRFAPHNRRLWEEDFVNLLDRIGRKTIHHAGPTADGRARRFFVKGHFLCAANALEKHFPDARFLTVIRQPAPRIQSAINYLRVNPFDPMLGPTPWTWLAQALLRTESEYCEVEQAWFTRKTSSRYCVVKFSDFVGDLEGTMQSIYRTCFGVDELPPHVPRSHTPRERHKYTVNRSLTELGIDETELNERLASYLDWCR